MQLVKYITASFCSLFLLSNQCLAQDMTMSLQDLEEMQCATFLYQDGRRAQYGNNCSNAATRVSDCIVIDLAGRSQRVDGVGRPVRQGERVRIGTDCQGDLPTARPAGIAPTIADKTVPWNGDDFERKFVAEVSPGSGHEITSIYLKQTRHFWPGKQLAHQFIATRIDDTNSYIVEPPLNEFWSKTDHVFYEWYIEYTSDLTGEAGSAKSSHDRPHNYVVECTKDQINDTLADIVDISEGFNDNPLFNPGYPGPSHIKPEISFRNQGMPYATPRAVAELGQPVVETPTLLQFYPGSGPANHPNRFFGAKLAGMVYGTLYTSLFGAQVPRPKMGCIPSSAWFVHEAGWHTLDGGLTVFPVVESFPGQNTGPLLPPNLNTVGVWHPRIWDLHVWLPKGSNGKAVLAIESPYPIPGVPLPTNAFFYPETFE